VVVEAHQAAVMLQLYWVAAVVVVDQAGASLRYMLVPSSLLVLLHLVSSKPWEAMEEMVRTVSMVLAAAAGQLAAVVVMSSLLTPQKLDRLLLHLFNR
jgi:nucleoside recognition membrane protein YjiH